MEVALTGSFDDCLFAETSTTPVQAVAAGNPCEEEPSSILETFCHSDKTTMQQHIFDDVVSLCSENGKKSRKQEIWESFTWCDGSYASITQLFSRLTKVSCFLIGRQSLHYGSI